MSTAWAHAESSAPAASGSGGTSAGPTAEAEAHEEARLRGRYGDAALGPVPDLSGFDREYIERFLQRSRVLLEGIFRMRVEGLEHLDLSKPSILSGNHNWGLWGITEVMGLEHAFYNQPGKRPPDLIAQGGPELRKIPLLNTLCRKAGVVVASMNGMLTPLRQGNWVLIQPGAVVDQGRPIWMRRKSRIKKVGWLGSRRVLTDQLGYVAAATEGGYPIYPVAWSGTHELSPILFESTRLLHLTGLNRLRREENLPSFPITLNHLINLGIFALTPLRASPWGWAAFLALNIYFDPAFCYPLFPFQLRIKIGEPIQVPDLTDGSLSAVERQRIYREIHARVVARVDEMLVELDAGRPWVAAIEKGKRWFARLAREQRTRRGASSPRPAINDVQIVERSEGT